MKAILAVNNIGMVGLDGGLPWRNLKDFQHFKKMTMGGILICGYNTFQTLPELKGREVLLDIREYNHEVWSEYFNLEENKDKEVWCIGGKKTYEKYAPYFTEIHISHIDDNTIGDTSFPDLSNLNPDCKVFNYHF